MDIGLTIFLVITRLAAETRARVRSIIIVAVRLPSLMVDMKYDSGITVKMNQSRP